MYDVQLDEGVFICLDLTGISMLTLIDMKKFTKFYGRKNLFSGMKSPFSKFNFHQISDLKI